MAGIDLLDGVQRDEVQHFNLMPPSRVTVLGEDFGRAWRVLFTDLVGYGTRLSMPRLRR